MTREKLNHHFLLFCISLMTMKRKILVVENDFDILQIIAHVLSEEGYEPILCSSEKGILEVVSNNQPDVILLDIFKITEQGTELCRTLKASEKTQHIPVIVLSTHPEINGVKEGCADEIVRKPFDLDNLLDVVKEQLAA